MVSSTVTAADSAWSAAHWSRPSSAPALAAPPLPGPVAPGLLDPGGPAPAPPWPAPPVSYPAPTLPASAFPAPGTPQWFTPPAPYAPPPPPQPVTTRRLLEAATPGLCLVLVIGGLIAVLAPLTLLIAFGLATRVRVAAQAVRRSFVVALSVLAFLSLLSAMTVLTNFGDFGDWWSAIGAWALFTSWVMLITTLSLVSRGLKNGTGGYAG